MRRGGGGMRMRKEKQRGDGNRHSPSRLSLILTGRHRWRTTAAHQKKKKTVQERTPMHAAVVKRMSGVDAYTPQTTSTLHLFLFLFSFSKELLYICAKDTSATCVSMRTCFCAYKRDEEPSKEKGWDIVLFFCLTSTVHTSLGCVSPAHKSACSE